RILRKADRRTARALSGLWLRLVLKSRSIQSPAAEVPTRSPSPWPAHRVCHGTKRRTAPTRRFGRENGVSGHPGGLGALEGRHRGRGTDSAGQCSIRRKGFVF